MLEIAGLSTSYGGFEFGPVDLAVDQEVLAVLGPSGSGKTTLLSLVAGTLSPDGGSVTLNGRRLTDVPLDERRTGLVFQDGALFPHMTARENIGYGASDGNRVENLAALFEITDVLDRRPPTLSGGERQRVALARTLAADPDALLLDEPLSSLDAPIRRRLRADLRGLLGSLDIPVVYVTHDQQTASALGDRLAIFREGMVEQAAPPSQVRDRPETRFVARFTGTENLFDATVVERHGAATTVRVGPTTVRAEGTDGASPGSAVTVCIHPSQVDVRRPNGSGDGDAVNTVSGTVAQWLNEGNEYRVDVDLDDTPTTVTAALQPPAFDRLPTDPGASVQLTVPPEAIHLILSPS